MTGEARGQAGQRRRGSRTKWAVIGLIAAALLGLAGYGLASWRPLEEIDATYGRRGGTPGRTSVNGTAVLAEMFRQRGFRVFTWRRLSPRLERAQVIVWVPDDFQPPDATRRTWLENWLRSEPYRTLIYVGRDYDAEVFYWEHAAKKAPPQQLREMMRREAAARVRRYRTASSLPDAEDGGWFRVRRDLPPREVRSLAGPWSDTVNATKTWLWLGERWLPPRGREDDVQLLLTAPVPQSLANRRPQQERQDVLVMRRWMEEEHTSQLLLVTNGSFLLNYALVNREHRKLAARLVEECNYDELHWFGEQPEVVFLESSWGGPPIRTDDDEQQGRGAMQMLTVWPLSVIAWHLIALGIIVCLMVFPIFGRPRALPEAPRSDFAKHVDALARLLEKTNDVEFAREKLQQYLARARRESGKSHRQPIEARQATASVTQPGSRVLRSD